MHSETAIQTIGEPEGLEGVLQDYIAIKDALVQDKYAQVKQEAMDLQSRLQGGGENALSNEQGSQLQKHARQLIEAENIEAQRRHFSALSRDLYQQLKNAGKLDKTLYWQHCPMALNNQGAHWLSMEEQVQNPYMGQRMPKCGSVEETIRL